MELKILHISPEQSANRRPSIVVCNTLDNRLFRLQECAKSGVFEPTHDDKLYASPNDPILSALKTMTIWETHREYADLRAFLEDYFPKTLWEIISMGAMHVRKADNFDQCDQETAHRFGRAVEMRSGWIIYPARCRVYRDSFDMSQPLLDGTSVSNVWREESPHDPGGNWYSVQITNNGGRIERSVITPIKML